MDTALLLPTQSTFRPMGRFVRYIPLLHQPPRHRRSVYQPPQSTFRPKQRRSAYQPNQYMEYYIPTVYLIGNRQYLPTY